MGEKILKMNAIDEKFYKFHKQNPEVYQALVDLAREAKQAGKKKIGIGMLWEVMRWNRFLETDDPDRYKLNNNYRSRYARLIMEKEGDLDGMFDIRKLRSQEDRIG